MQRRTRTPFIFHVKRLKRYHLQITNEEINTPPDEGYDYLELDEINEETCELKALDFTAHKEKRSTARYA